jgi:LysM repeat protein
MNNQTPTESAESPLTQRSQGRSRVKLYIFFVLALHFVGLMGLLMLGCQKEKEPVAPPMEQTNQPAFEPYTNSTPVDMYAPAPVDTNLPPVAAPYVETNIPPVYPEPTVPAGSEYAIVKGDTFSSIAKKHGISLRALTEANPSVNSTRLQINQKIQIPAAKATAPAPDTFSPSAAASPAPVVNEAKSYSVKSGDTLTKIAGHHGVTVRAIKDANNLRTEKIKVGQKLKIPAKKAKKSDASTAVPASPAVPSAGIGTTPGTP